MALAGHGSCALRDAACPRGARPGAGGARCIAPPVCPPGALPEGDGCRPVVTSGGRTGSRVDLGAWATLALGIAAIALAKGDTSGAAALATGSLHDPKANRDIPSVLLTPTVITKANVKDVITAGALTAAQICQGIQAACTAAGIS